MRWKCPLYGLGLLALSACGDDAVYVLGARLPSTPPEGAEGAGSDTQGVDPTIIERIREGNPPVAGLDGLRASECHVVEVTPAFAAIGVPITSSAEIRFTHPIDAAVGQEAIRWFELESEELLELDVEQVDTAVLRVKPRHELAFWRSYGLVVDTILSSSGLDCEGTEVAFSTVAPTFLPPPASLAPALRLARSGNTVYSTAPSLQGIQVHALAADRLELRSELHLGVPTGGISVSGPRAYVPAGSEGVVILDIAVPEAPSVMAHVRAPGQALDVVAFQRGEREVIAVAAARGGVLLMDVTAPEYPTLLARVDMSGVLDNSTTDLDVQGQWLAAADGRNGLHLIDVSDPANPIVVGSSTTSLVQQVELAGDRLYALYAGWPRVWAYDVANPAVPVAKWNSCGVPCGLLSMAFDVQGDKVFVATSQGGVHQLAVQPDGSLLPQQPVLKGSTAAMSVLASEGSLVVGSVGGLSLFSEGSTERPVFEALGHGDAHQVIVRGNYAYVASSFAGLQTFDVSDAENPRWVSRVDSPGVHAAQDRAATGVAIYQDVLILADGRAGISFFSLSDPAQPSILVSFADNFDHTGDIEIVGTKAYVCNDNGGVEVIDMTRPELPVRLEPIRFPATEDRSCRVLVAHPREGVLYVGGNFGLGIYDLASSIHPVHLGDYWPPPGSSVAGLAIDGERLFMSTTATSAASIQSPGSRLQIASLANPRAPVAAWQSEVLSIGPLSVVGQTLLMSAESNLSFYDISREAPRLQGVVSSKSAIRSFAASGAALYVAQSAGGLAVIRTGPLPVD